ncbi:hypothetical protein AK812_SmicGene24235 [Symbiodinium microadriaticum]|uniref:Uncharacterized protein n=1 Tax=Symbiodinium microadriaticum TaxID=2951 RepID=A0A1Q9DF80_SYMMI|nr:hypothetical protein AK812_SmicGene24235 [Symbiodinium microadriaticum]
MLILERALRNLTSSYCLGAPSHCPAPSTTMSAAAVLNKKTFVTVQEEVAHQRLIQSKWYPGGQPTAAIEGEDEVRFLGGDCYVPRLVAANVPIAKPAATTVGTAASYAEPVQAKRPMFLRGAGGGVAPTMGGYALPSGGGELPKGYVKQEVAKEPAFPFNLLNSPGI